MKKLLFFSVIGSLFGWRVAAQTGDTQGVAMQLSAKSSLYDRVAVLNHIQNQEYEEAIAYLAPILKADSGNSALLGYAGYSYYMNDDYRSAGACYQRLLAIDSNNIPALHYLLLIDMNDHPADAMNYASRLVRLQKDRAPWSRMMGELFGRLNQRDSALEYFNRAYTLAPNDIRTIAGLTDLLMGSKDFGPVDSMLDVAQERDSLNPTLQKLAVQALTRLALSYYELKQYPDCIRVCEHMLQIGLEQEAVYYYESRAWTKMGQYRTSDSLLRIALKIAISPTAEWYYFDLASNHESLHEHREAVANYDTAYYLFRDPTVLYTCGRICETEMHGLGRARRYYLRYLEVAKPKTAAEKEALAYVRRRWGRK